jgi:glucosamine--fructose-6-phosphate aminotransferase (isomerizing)
MEQNNKKYSKYALVEEMLEITEVIKNFDPSVTERFILPIREKGRLFFTGEGSSRIFPAKRAIYEALKKGNLLPVSTEGATQALEYILTNYAVFGASNSGKTKEIVRLFEKLKNSGHNALFGLTANSDTPLESMCRDTHVLNCGKEKAVAATKSVVEQALFYDSLIHHLADEKMEGLNELSEQVGKAMKQNIESGMIEQLKNADIIYFAVLEGTYVLHGIEEIMDKNEVVILVEPFESEEEKIKECLAKGVGMKVISISARETLFPTIKIPDGGKYHNYIELAAGWNVLVEIGIALGIDLDKPVRARKVGNEYIVG